MPKDSRELEPLVSATITHWTHLFYSSTDIVLPLCWLSDAITPEISNNILMGED